MPGIEADPRNGAGYRAAGGASPVAGLTTNGVSIGRGSLAHRRERWTDGQVDVRLSGPLRCGHAWRRRRRSRKQWRFTTQGVVGAFFVGPTATRTAQGGTDAMAKVKAEYIWLDGYEPVPNLRSKTKIVE